MFVVRGEPLFRKFPAQVFHAGLDQVRRAAGDWFLAHLFRTEFLHFRVHGSRGAAIVAQGNVRRLGGDVLPAAELDVQNRLHAYDLGGGGHQRNPAQGLADYRDFREYFLKFVFHALFLELGAEVGKHAAGHLVAERVRVHHFVAVGGEFAQTFIDGFEHFGDFNELVRVVIRLAGIAVQQGKHAQAVRLARAVGEGGDGDIARVHSGINGAEVSGCAEAGGVMRVDPDGDVQVLFQGADEFLGDIRRNEAGHILDDDGVRSHIREFPPHVHKSLSGVHGRSRVADGAVGLRSGFLGGADGGFHVARVVHAVENAEDVHAVLGAHGDKGFHHVVRIVGVAHDILAAQQHHVRRLGGRFFQGVQPVERPFFQEAQPGVDGGAAPGFQGAEAHGVQNGGDGQHVCRLHACCRQGLMPVAQNGAVECNRIHYLVNCC